MANHKLFAPKLLKVEGGYVNHPNDPGGATMKGVTHRVFKAFCKSKGRPEPTIQDLKNISDSDWTEIFKVGYWDKINADQIKNQSIAEVMVDWIFNSGPGMVKNIQRLLGLKADGIAGINTITTINSADQKKLFENLILTRHEFYDTCVRKNPKLAYARKGWTNRLNEFKYVPYIETEYPEDTIIIKNNTNEQTIKLPSGIEIGTGVCVK